MLKEKKLFQWHIGGFFFIVFFSSLIHFSYDMSGGSVIVALFAPVNESVWEHLKLSFTSLMVFSAIEYWFVRYETKNYWLAKGAGILIMSFFILAFFYAYTAIIGMDLFLFDIVSYIVGIVLLQAISLRIMLSRNKSWMLGVGTFLLVIHAALLVWFTFEPPHLDPWQDSITGEYGINLKNNLTNKNL